MTSRSDEGNYPKRCERGQVQSPRTLMRQRYCSSKSAVRFTSWLVLSWALSSKEEIVLLQISDGVASAVANYNRDEDQIHTTAEGSGSIVSGDFRLRTRGWGLGTGGWCLGEG
jgi:hypothetical protein